MAEKSFAVSFAVSCKNMQCEPNEAKCQACIKSIIDAHIRHMNSFKVVPLTTSHGSRRFDVSFIALCRKPDCSESLPRNIACCTASPDKCELCLRSIVMREIHLLDGFHVKEIVVA